MSSTPKSEDFELGFKMMAEVLGDQAPVRTMEICNDFNRKAYETAIEYGFGRIWGDKALTKKQHSLNNLCLLAALNRPREFRIHFKGALRNGCSKAELSATISQIMAYAGFPAGVEAMHIAEEVIAAWEAKGRPIAPDAEITSD